MISLIFGSNGQDGYYLNKLLVNNGFKLIGVSRSDIENTVGDVSNYKLVERLIKDNLHETVFSAINLFY